MHGFKNNLSLHVSQTCMDITRVYVTKCIGVYIDSRLNWNEHILVTRKKRAKNVLVMNRVKH